MKKEKEENSETIYLDTIDSTSQIKLNLYGLESFFNTRAFEPDRKLRKLLKQKYQKWKIY